jgi:Ricin-type beta-trefoil lectin domain
MLSNKTSVITAVSILVTVFTVLLGQTSTGAALASTRPAPPGLHLVPVSNSSVADTRASALVAATAYHVVNADGQCMDADSNHWGTNGDNVQLWSCNSNGEQNWYVSGAHIVNADGQCLDADSNHWGTNGDNVQLWSCNSNGEQNWYGSPTNVHWIVSADGQCLDADSNHWGTNGDNVQLWSCNSNGEQSWEFSS